jgi:large subunit ribosomal protein L25
MDVILTAQQRNPSTKAKQLRKEGWVPGCIYGKSMESYPVQIKQTDLTKCLKMGAVKLNIKVGNETYLASIEEVQKNCVGTEFHHISFHAFDANEKVSMHVPVHLENKAIGQTNGGILQQQTSEVTVYGYAKDLPDEITVDVSKLELGNSLHISDLPQSNKWEIKDNADKVIVACNYPKLQAVEETPVAQEAPEVEQTVSPEDEQKEAA